MTIAIAITITITIAMTIAMTIEKNQCSKIVIWTHLKLTH